MLAVFPKTVAQMPEELQKPHPDEAVSAMTHEFLTTQFLEAHPNSVSINLGSSGILAYSLEKKITILARSFAVKDGLFCIFQGHLDNSQYLKLQFGLTKVTDDALIVMDAYRMLRDVHDRENTKPPERLVKEFEGLYGYILFDIKTNTIFIGSDSERSVSFFWGTDVEGNLVFSDDHDIVKKACSISQGPFPKDCLFTSAMGLRNLEHPMNEMKAVPLLDSSGEICGTKFEVDTENRRAAKYCRAETSSSSRDWVGDI